MEPVWNLCSPQAPAQDTHLSSWRMKLLLSLATFSWALCWTSSCRRVMSIRLHTVVSLFTSIGFCQQIAIFLQTAQTAHHVHCHTRCGTHKLEGPPKRKHRQRFVMAIDGFPRPLKPRQATHSICTSIGCMPARIPMQRQSC